MLKSRELFPILIEFVLVAARKEKDKELPLGACPPLPGGVGMVVKGACHLAFLIGRLGHRGKGLVGVLNKLPEAAEQEWHSPAVQCES